MHEIYVDADSCPVKDEIVRVATRHALSVHVVSNQSQRVPEGEAFRAVLVGDGFDEADDWIATHAGPGDIVVTADILLAARCLALGARALTPRGRVFADTSIGEALAARETQALLREMGLPSKGPPPFTDKDRSRFLQRLDELVHAVRRAQS
ncbi:MAG: YaiI/YqxD family protein [Planctomycetes bacterium]|nr:YaiI/YqxD family protein [Planctomycetota bacterium]